VLVAAVVGIQVGVGRGAISPRETALASHDGRPG
jgi:hypothetical protein